MAGPDVLAPVRLGPVTAGLADDHLAVARGGVAMTTVACLAVATEGRTPREPESS